MIISSKKSKNAPDLKNALIFKICTRAQNMHSRSKMLSSSKYALDIEKCTGAQRCFGAGECIFTHDELIMS